MLNASWLGTMTLLVCLTGLAAGYITVVYAGETYGVHMMIASTAVCALTSIAAAYAQHHFNNDPDDRRFYLTGITCFGAGVLSIILGIIEMGGGNAAGRWTGMVGMTPLLLMVCHPWYNPQPISEELPVIPDMPARQNTGSSKKRRPARLRRKRRARSRRA